ncbi:MAG TPA: ABC transporter permease, partial [Burkholderiaceae bacterium]|nr:ABC transporter permease [Burkholderiaceae bacterium]
MLVYVLRRLLVAFSVMLTVALVSFMLLHLSGDLATAIAGPEASAADVEKVRIQYGLDRPIAAQFTDWLGAALRLDFGRSFYFQNTVMELVGERL